MPEPAHKQFQLGQLVEGKVEKVFPYGVFVRLDHNIRAYIRRRELSLTGDCEPRQIVYVGKVMPAIVCALSSPGRMLELSHKATLPDPWDGFLRSFHEGDVVQGNVKDVRAYGLFVEILPGVDGFIPLSESIAWRERPEKRFWTGDLVEAVITSIDLQNRKARLSIQKRLEHLGRVAEIIEMLNQRSKHDTLVMDVTPAASTSLAVSTAVQALPPMVDPATQARVGRILIVEDSPEIAGPLVIWLAHHGYTANIARTAEEVGDQLEQFVYGLLLVDIDLAMSNGLTIIKQMKDKLAGATLAIMSAPERLEEHAREIEELGVAETFVKPLDLDEIGHLLTRIGRGDVLPFWRASPSVPRVPAFQAFRAFTTAFHGKNSDQERLGACLSQLVKSVGADDSIIFKQDPISRKITICVHVGSAIYNEAALYSLKESPVKDVIQEHDFIFENHVLAQAESRFRKLLDLLAFESCIGIPIEAEGEAHHALFLFHRRARAFKHYHLRDAMATATLCAALLERTSFNQQIWSLNQLLLNGQLAASFGHEVFNKLSGLEIQLHNLQTDYSLFSRQAPAPSSVLEPMQQDLARLIETAKDMRRMVENFQRLMKAEDEQALAISDVVGGVIGQLRPLAYKNGIKLKSECAPDVPRVIGNPMRLQQVLFNLILNAIQHLETNPQKVRTVQVTVVYVNAAHEHPVKLRVIDNGPGIHKQLWEKIFDLSFTSRPEGTGLGLFIARSLVGAMGGKLSVEHSVILLGTTFLVELPAFVPTEEKAL